MDSEQKDQILDSPREDEKIVNEATEEDSGSSVAPSLSSTAGSREDNPFSFRHFLRTTQSHVTNSTHDYQKATAEEQEASKFGGARPKTSRRSTLPPLENDIKSPCGLPDFVQDYLGVEHETGPGGASSNNCSFSDQYRNSQSSCENPLDLPRSHSPIHAAGAMPIPLDIANLATSPIEDEVAGRLDLANLNTAASQSDVLPQDQLLDEQNTLEANEINNNENLNSLSQLPDFLSDGPMQSGRINQEPMLPTPSNQSLTPNETVIEENLRLRQQLEISIANEREALTRIGRLETLLESMRRRELEETSSLEKSMEQIETNLKLATQRAVQAESQLNQLKRENRRLQDEVKRLQEALLQSSRPNAGSPRNLSETARELQIAADNAERSIRDLLAGVEHLRVVAATIESREKIEEVRYKRDRDK